MDLLALNAYNAGYANSHSGTLLPVFRDSCGTTINNIDVDFCSDDTSSIQGDRIGFVMKPRDGQDCLGNTIDVDSVVVNVFWVQSMSGSSALYCRGFNPENDSWVSVGQPYVEGIEQMQIQYGVASAGSDVVTRYLNATSVEANSAWGSVKTIKVSLLVYSGLNTDEANADLRTVSTELQASTYDKYSLLDGSEYDPTDSRLRRIATKTFVFRNAI